MNAIDTNVFVYRLERKDPTKRAKAKNLLTQLRAASVSTVLLWQVVGEFVRVLRSWQDQGLIQRSSLMRYVRHLRSLFTLTMPTPAVLDRALDLSGRYSLPHWDSMLLGACLEAGVTVLYTEDMGAPVSYDGVQLINPFI